MTEKQAREQILQMTAEYYKTFHSQQKPYEKGDRIPFAARVYDSNEITNLVDSALEFWLTAGRFTEQFETRFPAWIGSKYCSLVNSGSSANLLAIMSLTSTLLEERALKPGDEVITVAAGFPTTVTPIIQAGAVPVFVDVKIPSYNINTGFLENALSGKTKAVILAHTLGIPFDLATVKDFCEKHNLWLIEDNCDALGAKFIINGQDRYTGSVGDIGASSFYPAHHMTMGEGGAVYTNNPLLHKIVRSLRDWGRDCACPGGMDNLCGHRFEQQYGALPFGYDHKYVYSHFGYNLKATDMQAAIGVAQIEKLPVLIEKRIRNAETLIKGLKDAGAETVLILPEVTAGGTASWFGLPLTCKPNLSRHHAVIKLEERGIQTRSLFAGNLVRHPCFDIMRKSGTGYRIAGNLEETDRIMNDTFWIGVHPGLSDAHLEYMVEQLVLLSKKA